MAIGHAGHVLILQILATLFALFVLLRLAGIDGNRYTAALLALTPLFVPVGLILCGLLLGFGQPILGAGCWR